MADEIQDRAAEAAARELARRLRATIPPVYLINPDAFAHAFISDARAAGWRYWHTHTNTRLPADQARAATRRGAAYARHLLAHPPPAPNPPPPSPWQPPQARLHACGTILDPDGACPTCEPAAIWRTA